jgi:hypothetical protein
MNRMSLQLLKITGNFNFWLFRGAVLPNNIFKTLVLILFLYPLHFSAPVGHPQEEYAIT